MELLDVPQFQEPVPIVIGGGTSLVKGFMEVFMEQFNQDEFPIPVSEVKLIEDAHTAVSRGCLSEAQLVEEDENEAIDVSSLYDDKTTFDKEEIPETKEKNTRGTTTNIRRFLKI